MNQALGLVYGTAGNHEMSPVNGFQPNSLGNSAQWVYDVLSKDWSASIGQAGAAEVEQIGAYSVKYAGGNLRVISLNMNVYYRDNYWLYQRTMMQDPNNQLWWLVQQLDAAEKAGENVYVVGHMPPGPSDAFHDSSNYFDQIINRYSASVAAMFFGHTHVDQLEISYPNYSDQTAANAMATSYICPSLTPTSGMPSFRVYDVDPVTFGVLDSTTYMADMNDTAFQTTGPVWTKYYSAKEAYGAALNPPVTAASAEISPAFWHNVTEVFESNDAVFQAYIARKSRDWAVNSCTGDCKTSEICQIRAARSQDNCNVPTPGVHFSKRSEDRVRERDECGITVTRATINSLAVKKEGLMHLHRRYVGELDRQMGL